MKKKKANNDNYKRVCDIPELVDVKIALTGVVNIDFTAEEFFDYYDAIGWSFGNKVIRNWRALLRKWIRNPKKKNIQVSVKTIAPSNYWSEVEKQVMQREQRLAQQKAQAVTYEQYMRMKAEGRV